MIYTWGTYQSPCHPLGPFSPYWNAPVTHFKVHTSLLRLPPSQIPICSLYNSKDFPLTPVILTIFSHGISYYPLCSLPVCSSPFLHRQTALAMSSLLFSSLLSLIHNKNFALHHFMERPFQWFLYCISCIQEDSPTIRFQSSTSKLFINIQSMLMQVSGP